MTDVVYVLGSGSGWNNNELRFSLRSIGKLGINAGNIFVVGVRPDFLSDEVIHIPVDDIYNPTLNADGNIAHKVLAACADERLSDDFLFINDDHILLKPIDLKDIPAFHKGDMNTFPATYWTLNYWRNRLKRTMETLNKQGLPANHFDCHTPMVINKKLFPEVMARFDFSEGIGLTMKSIYGNCVYAETGKLLDSEKKTVFENFTVDQLTARLADCDLMSFNDSGLNQSLKVWLYRQLPEQSKWETTEPDDRTLAVLKWMDTGKDYLEGVNIFIKYMHGTNLTKLFRNSANESLRKKLEYKLINTISEL